MRILRVAQKTYPDVKGGGPYHVHAISRDQAAMGHDVAVLTVDSGSEKRHVEERAGYTLIRYPSTVELLGNDISAGIGQHLLDAEGFDVLHAHSHLYFSTNLAALKRRFGDVPLAITNHGLYSQNAPEWVFDWYLKSIGRWTFNRADTVFCYTEEDRDRVRGFGVESYIEVVSNGVDTERFTPAGPTSERIDHDGPVVLFVGRLVEGKRPGDAIAALERVREEFPDARLYLCGEGPMRAALEAQVADRGLEDVVRFLGQVEYDEMPALYRTGDVLVLPSRAEGLPRTVLEAMACNVPVVCSDLEQVTPVIDGAGTTVTVGDVDGFARAIDRALSGHYGDGREIVEEKFTWSDTVERTTRTLERLSADG
ncbi:glycosyltransferase family 4 protein [Halalkalicoccus sp. NIPERK01]|uniref:glycosyltransferase family 4 protein n=1 Tax=Halalkalicoccus sp. NIPERK01 TaxID=3053469 RepID=UPI00256F2B58|nr:glycosyltransferase family 4 protein [Halalkalicoccus sp. NIPERK01]MDL5363421.1 glycosyltransferase family 4 protein [Halalkalicoccus sp. NIPERK01]